MVERSVESVDQPLITSLGHRKRDVSWTSPLYVNERTQYFIGRDWVFKKINDSVTWRAVDQDVLDILVQSHRDKKAAKKFFRKLLKGLRCVPSAIVTDKLRSYSAAKAEVLPSVEHCEQKYQNNRAENSHHPTRLRERVMRRFKSARHAQRFISAFGVITSHFRVGRHLYGPSAYRAVMKLRFAVWEEAICSI